MKIDGQVFFPRQQECEDFFRGGKFFIRTGSYKFSAFPSVNDFLKWFDYHKSRCTIKSLPVEIYEVTKNFLTNAFFADIEIYATTLLDNDQVENIQNIVIESVEKSIRKIYPNSSGVGTWTSNHRTIDKPDKKFKISLHLVVNDILFDDISRNGPMHSLASEVNGIAVDSIKSIGGNLVNSLIFPNDDVFDLGVYHVNRTMRCIWSTKTAGEPGFTPVGSMSNIGDYFITKGVPIDEIPDRNFCSFSRLAVKTKPKKTYPTKTREVLGDKPEMVQEIVTHLKTWGDYTSNIMYKGENKDGCHTFEVRGPERVCPTCNITHDGNGAYVTFLGSGNYSYMCLSPSNPSWSRFYFSTSKFDDNPSKKRKTCNKYLQSLVGITQKAIVVKAPMGSGKTTRTWEFIKSLEENPSVLWVTPRKAMATAIRGKYPQFSIYTETLDQDYQIVEYESLYKLNRTYDVIVLDEIRSLIKTFTCVTTNRDHLMEHIDFLAAMCKYSRHTLMLDADVLVDGAVKTFTDHVFEKDDVSFVQHIGKGMDLHHVFAHEEDCLKMLYDDLREGRRVMVCCGSSQYLKSIAKIASEIPGVGIGKVGIFYADCDIQHELDDVNSHCPKYQLVGFTSTITVSVSFDFEFHRVYVIPVEATACPREMCQMEARARKNITGEVVVQVSKTHNKIVAPINVDHDSLYDEKMQELLRKRKQAVTTICGHEKAYVSSVKKVPSRVGMLYVPHLLTHLGAWDKVEEYLKDNFWYRHYLSIISGKGFTWSWDLVHQSTASTPTPLVDNVKQGKDELKQKLVHDITEMDALNITPSRERDLVRKKSNGTVSEKEIIMYRKHLVQRYFSKHLTGDDVILFEKNGRAVTNLLIRTRVSSVLRKKLYLNSAEMGPILEFYSVDGPIISLLEECLRSVGISNVFDRRSKLDSNRCRTHLPIILDKIAKIDPGRGCQSSNPFTRLKYYLEKVMGFTFEATRVMDNKTGKKIRMYNLSTLYPEWEAKDSVIGTEEWVRREFERYDHFKKIPLGSEFKFNQARERIIRLCNKHVPGRDRNPFVGI